VRIAYIFEQFPCPSETFALREIECLVRHGLQVTVLCARRGSGGMNGRVQVIASPRPLGIRWFSALAHLLTSRLKQLPSLAALWWRIAIRSPRQAMGLLFDLHLLGEFSRAIDAHGIRHVHGYWLGWPARIAAAMSVLTGVSMSLSGHAKDIFTETVTLDVLARRAEFIAVCTGQGLRRLQSVLGQSHLAKVQLIRHGLLPREMDRPESRRNGDSAAPHVVACGRLVAKKGFDVLIHAFGQVNARRNGIHLTIIGDGPQQESLKSLTRQLGLDDCISFAGWLPHEEAMESVGQMAMLVVPSVLAADGDRDGTPNVILEAFARGTPVVASRLPGIAEAVEHEVSGLLADPGDPTSLAEAICRLAGDRRVAENLMLGGRRVLEAQFDAMSNSERLATLFKEAIGRSC
jgi:colanic acid/amylovoran biosynthesis glycosyltransferase